MQLLIWESINMRRYVHLVQGVVAALFTICPIATAQTDDGPNIVPRVSFMELES